MTRSELIDAVKASGGCSLPGMTKAQAERAVLSVLDSLMTGVASEGDARLHNFGHFRVVRLKACKRRNPKTQEVIDVPEKWTVKFTPSDAFLRAIEAEADEGRR